MSARTAARLGILVAIAATLQIAESLVPKPLPWLRLGLANGVTLLAIARLGAAPAFGVAAARVLLGGLVLGTLGSPPFVLSAAGSAAAALVMAAAWRAAAPPLSLLGVSVLGSAAHVAGQLAALGALFGLGRGVLALAPALAITAVPLGLVTGAVILAVHRRLPPW
jgi:heptaprenyl diphosphate synthase